MGENHMANEHLSTYLNDHLAGSVAAIELLEHLEASEFDGQLTRFFSDLRGDIAADRAELENLMKSLNIDESRTRKASAWLTGKFTELKLRVDDPAGGALRLFESLEVLSLGIEGKRSLWKALIAVSEQSPSLKVMNYDRLIKRAEEQRERVERHRLITAQQALDVI